MTDYRPLAYVFAQGIMKNSAAFPARDLPSLFSEANIASKEHGFSILDDLNDTAPKKAVNKPIGAPGQRAILVGIAVILLIFFVAYSFGNWWMSGDGRSDTSFTPTAAELTSVNTGVDAMDTPSNSVEIRESDSSPAPVFATILERRPETASSNSAEAGGVDQSKRYESEISLAESQPRLRPQVQPVVVPPAEPFRVSSGSVAGDSASVDAIAAALNSELPLVVPAKKAVAPPAKKKRSPAKSDSDVDIIAAIIEGRVLK